MKSSAPSSRAVVCLVVFLALILLAPPPATRASSSGIVVSQVYGGGGNAGSTFKNDFIELFNAGSGSISLTGWSVQYASAAGTTWQVTPLNGTLASGQYYLIQESQGAGGTTNLPAPNATGTIAMSATAGKVALVSSTTALSGGCPVGGSIIDFVGYGTGGSGASCFEGNAAAPTLTNTTADLRNASGAQDTDNNTADFTAGPPNPRNSVASSSPTGTGSANPSSVAQGGSTLLRVAVTPGTGPASTGITVTGDLSSIGGSATQQFFDDGTHGDAVAGDNAFSFQASIPAATSAGAKTIPTTIADAQGRSGSASIALTVTSPITPPTGVASANPNSLQAGGLTLLTVNVTPGANPVSTGIGVVGDLSLIGGSGSQQFFDDGTHGDVTANDNVFSFNATVASGITPGSKALPITVNDAQARSSATTASLTVQSPPAPNTVKISQVYGGGGNSGSTYTNDFIEIFNEQSTPVDVSSWSVQYDSAGDSGVWQVTNLCPAGTGCNILPGHYYLIQESKGAGGTTSLPTADAIGIIALSSTNGKVALVADTAPMSGACPTGASLVDFVGYGSANCSEGSPTSALSNTSAAVRKGNGCVDTDHNVNDFVTIGPIPRNGAAPPNFCGGDPSQPSGLGTASPASLEPAANTLLTVQVTPATAPPSTGLAVVADLTSIGGGAAQPLFDDGSHGDPTAGDNVFSFQANIGAFIATGAKNMVATITDAQGRTATAPITLTVQSPTCGVERWSVKTGTDPDAALVGLNSSMPAFIADLGAIPPPAVPPDNSRIVPTETTVYVVNGTMTLYKKETDVDYHIVVQDNSGHTMIAEIPSPACVGASSPFAPAVAGARARFDARLTATPDFQTANFPVQIKGVGFFDFIHGQTGVAPNGIELHPVLEINFTATTTTALISSANPSEFGQPVGLAATVSNGGVSTPTGKVTFLDGGSSIGSAVLDQNGQATFTTSTLGVGSHSITASYEGDSKAAPSVSAPLVQVVNKANQAIHFGPLADRTFGDADFTVSATASSGLPVTFSIFSGPATISGNSVHLTGAGAVTVRASQAGDSNYNAAADVDQSFTVAKAGQAIAFAPLPDKTFGDPPFTVSATGGGSGNPVTFGAGGNCTAGGINGSVITLTGAGSCTVTASQAGDANYNAAPDVPRSFNAFPPPVLNLPDTITAEATSPAGAVVSFTATATDVTDGSIPAICTPASGSTFALGNTTVNCSATNSRNKTVTGSFLVQVVDTIAPVIQCTHPDSAWHGTDVVLNCTAVDSGSGLKDPADASFTLTTNVPPGTENANAGTNSHQVCDLSGACAVAGPFGGIKVDKAPPVVSAVATVNGSPFVSGAWTNQTVVVTFACTDGGSGVASATPPVSVTGEGANQSVNGSCTDQVGNSSNASFTGINIDRTAPNPPTASAAPPANAAGWNNSDVVVSVTSNGDAGPVQSGVVSCTAPVTVGSETGGTTVSGSCRDLAGNSSASASITVKIDKTPPTVAVVGVTNGATYVLGAVPTATCSSADALSGIATSATLNVTGGNAFHVGKFTATCSGATDRAGNVAPAASVTYGVQYIFVGFLHDGNEDEDDDRDNGHDADDGKRRDQDDDFRAGRTIPLKWLLRTADGSFVRRLSAIRFVQFASNPSCTIGAEGTAVNASSAGNSGLQLDGAVYEFNWQTKGLAPGCYSVLIGLDDDTVRSRLVLLR